MKEEAGLSGMTVNERLFTKGLLDQFEAARATRDTGSLRQIFELIELPDYDIEQLLTR